MDFLKQLSRDVDEIVTENLNKKSKAALSQSGKLPATVLTNIQREIISFVTGKLVLNKISYSVFLRIRIRQTFSDPDTLNYLTYNKNKTLKTNWNSLIMKIMCFLE